MITVEWKGSRVFEARPPSGNSFLMDAYPESGGHDRGPTPIEVFVASGAACSAMDVIQILEKKRLKITKYNVEVDGERTAEGVYPRPYTSIRFTHVIEGEDLDEDAVAQAVRLSDEKYCSVIATLRASPLITSGYRLAVGQPEMLSRQP